VLYVFSGVQVEYFLLLSFVTLRPCLAFATLVPLPDTGMTCIGAGGLACRGARSGATCASAPSLSTLSSQACFDAVDLS
jgi:hypothetical protein